MEVAYIGSSIGQSVEKFLIDEKKCLDSKFQGHLSSLLRVAGLVHDIGNPPYGHFGEEAIKQFFTDYFKDKSKSSKFTEQERSDFTNFDGNVQAFRILRRLHFFGDEYSFNLTYPALASVIKYPSNSIEGNKGKMHHEIAKRKFGYFVSEEAEYRKINETLLLKNKRHPAVYLMEAADDIAYSAADIEDGVKIGVLGYDQIIEAFSSNLGKNKDLIKVLEDTYEKFKNHKSDRLPLTVQKFRIITQSRMINAILETFKNNYDLIMSGSYEHELIDQSDAADIRISFKKLQFQVFDDKTIITKELAGYKVLYGLLEIFVKASESSNFKSSGNNWESRLYRMISSSYRNMYENYSVKYNPNDSYNRIQLIIDFISGMTDRHALSLYQKLNGIKL